MAWDVMSGVTKMAWNVMSGVTKTAWDVLSKVANLCGMFCPGCKKMAWNVLSRDVLSGSHLFVHAARKPDFVTCRAEYASAQSDIHLYFSLFLDLPYAKIQDC